MTIVESKRSKIKFYVVIVFSTIFYCGMGTIMLVMFSDHIANGKVLETKNYSWPVLSCFLYFMAAYTIIRYIKNSPTIVVDNNQISFNKEIYHWKNVAEIELTGKQPFKYLFNFPMEGAMITLNDGTIKYFFDDMYTNSWKVKSFIQQVIINKKDIYETTTHRADKTEIQFGNFEIFKGNQFTSLRGIILWGLIGFFIFMMFSTSKIPPKGFFIFAGIFATVWFIFNSYLMHYFALSSKYFAIRNHNFIWLNKVYKVDDIREIVFETQGKMPHCLRVITKDFRNKLYPAGTLQDKIWLELKDKLELKGVTVRNECIY